MSKLDQLVIDQLTKDLKDIQKVLSDIQETLTTFEEWQLVVEDKLADLRTDVNRQDLSYVDGDFD